MAWLVDPRLHDDSKILSVSIPARYLFVVLLTGPQRTVLPGLQKGVSAAIIADTMRTGVLETEAWMAELTDVGLVQFDREVRVVRLPNAPRYNSAPNLNVLTAWWRQWRDIPDCQLKFDHVPSLLEAVNEATSPNVRQKWDETFGRLRGKDAGRMPAPFPKDARSGSGLGSGLGSGIGSGMKDAGRMQASFPHPSTDPGLNDVSSENLSEPSLKPAKSRKDARTLPEGCSHPSPNPSPSLASEACAEAIGDSETSSSGLVEGAEDAENARGNGLEGDARGQGRGRSAPTARGSGSGKPVEMVEKKAAIARGYPPGFDPS